MKMIHVRDQVNDKIWLQSWLLFNRRFIIINNVANIVYTKIKNQTKIYILPIEIQIVKEISK